MPLTAAATAALMAHQTGDALIALLTLDHADLADPLRVARNTVDVVSRGETYAARAFAVTLPQDDGETLATVRLTLDNVDRAFTEAVRTIDSPLDATIELVLASAPDTVEAGPWIFSARNAGWNASQIEFELGHEDVLNREHLPVALDPWHAPAMYR